MFLIKLTLNDYEKTRVTSWRAKDKARTPRCKAAAGAAAELQLVEQVHCTATKQVYSTTVSSRLKLRLTFSSLWSAAAAAAGGCGGDQPVAKGGRTHVPGRVVDTRAARRRRALDAGGGRGTGAAASPAPPLLAVIVASARSSEEAGSHAVRRRQRAPRLRCQRWPRPSEAAPPEHRGRRAGCPEPRAVAPRPAELLMAAGRMRCCSRRGIATLRIC